LEARPFRTKLGKEVTICPFFQGALEGLVAFYDQLEPKEAYQGLPPRLEETRRQWVERLLREGDITFLALYETRVIGHTSAIPIPSTLMAELLVFVHQDFRNQGIGTELIHLVAEAASTRGLECLWLTVSTSNSIAVHVYRKCGFCFIGPMDSEREMILRLC